MKPVRALGVAAVTVCLTLAGCTSAVDGVAQQDSGTGIVCDEGYELSQIGKCVLADEVTLTAPTPVAQPVPAEPSVGACDGLNCDLSVSNDEVDRLIAKSLDDVTVMWAANGVDVTLHMFKNGIGTCDGDGSDSAAAWVCPSSKRGGWSPSVLRSWAVERGATLEDTVRATIAHEVGHMVLHIYNADSDDLDTDELRADCMGGGYAKWTMLDPANSAMGQLTLERAQNVLYGSKSGKAVAAGYHGTPSTCTEYTP
ncbi:MAG: hypothetical protein KDB26_09375 [Microthrixaceae bacterium]|nr:hypothetical protein [Microthrixaceae bacterium]